MKTKHPIYSKVFEQDGLGNYETVDGLFICRNGIKRIFGFIPGYGKIKIYFSPYYFKKATKIYFTDNFVRCSKYDTLSNKDLLSESVTSFLIKRFSAHFKRRRIQPRLYVSILPFWWMW